MIASKSKTQRPGGKAAILWLAVLAICPSAWASPSALCDSAARHVAERVGVPTDILLAVTRAETGRTRHGRFAPWPWTVNIAGRGYWFATRAAAQSFVDARKADGQRSIDIGCFQINTRWHGENFPGTSAMFEPRQNALYAARFLRRLHAETEDWEAAIGTYHSRTPDNARRYRARVGKIRAALPNGTAAQSRAALPSWPLASLGGPAAARPGAPTPGGARAGGRVPIGVNLRAGRPVDMSPRAAWWGQSSDP